MSGADQPRITCPICRMTSYNPTDISEGYCGNCHDWTTPRIHSQRQVDLNRPGDPRRGQGGELL
jgi:hypothetical protein